MTFRRLPLATRRQCLQSFGALTVASALGKTANASTLPEAKLLLGGTLASIPGQFGELAEGPISKGLGLDTPIQLQPDLGQDGVTAANLFDANEAPDGRTAIVVPGATLLASLTGDSRVHYDFGRWIPLMLARTATVVVGRIEMRRSFRMRIEGFFHNHSVRLAVSRASGPELSAMLGLTLLGMRPIPVPGFVSAEQALAALRDGTVDAVQISPCTMNVPLAEVLKSLPAGTAPLYQTGDISDLQAEQIPNFLEAYQQVRRKPPEGLLYQAWQGVSSSTDTAVTVALPMLTSPDVVMQWRKACALAVADSGMRHWAELRHFWLADGANAAPLLSRATPPLSATLALRRWIAINTPRWRSGQETRPL